MCDNRFTPLVSSWPDQHFIPAENMLMYEQQYVHDAGLVQLSVNWRECDENSMDNPRPGPYTPVRCMQWWTSGSVSKGGESCSLSPSEGYCEGRYNKVTGTYSMRINQDGLPSSVNVSIQITVESGQLNIGIETPGGEIVQASASPGTPAQLEATAVVETSMGDRGFRVISRRLEKAWKV